jgi:uracil-DNA glycosylase
VDAKERLRLYLEQRRELGERELLLDGMNVEEVLALVGAASTRRTPTGPIKPLGGEARPRAVGEPPSTPRPPAAAEPDAPRLSALPQAFAPEPREAAPDEEPEDDETEAAAPTTPVAPPVRRPAAPTKAGAREAPDLHGGDWRAALRAAGAAAPPGDSPPTASLAPSVEPDDLDGDDSMARKAAAKRGGTERDGMQESPAPGAATPDGVKGEAPPSGIARPVEGVDVPGGLAVGRRDDAEANPFSRVRTLDGLAEKIAGCTRCDLYKSATHPVPGEGNPDADVVVVGEAPGENEDLSGRPFVGASGQLLTKILAAIKLAREDVFIVNVLKHRPPGNRNPTPSEVRACSPYLVRQLEILQPKVIICFGTFAAQTLLDTKTSIGKLRGSVHRYYGVPLIVTYHPAALLRNPAWKRPAWEDVQLARRILDRPAGS